MKLNLQNSVGYFLFLNTIFFNVGVYANTDTSLIRTTDRLQQLQEEQRRILENQAIAPKKEATKLNIEAPNVIDNADRQCFDINEIIVEGIESLSDENLERIKKKYTNECLYSKKISDLMSEITQAYFQKGYVTTRIYLPPQNIKNTKILKLRVDEGQISKLVATPRAEKTISIKTAAPFLRNEPLNLRDLEQALDQFNRLSSNNVTMQIQPGERVGESIVVFDNEPSKRISGYFSFDNKGQDSTGRNQGTFGLSVDNFFGLNDQLSISYNRALPFQIDKKDSEGINAFYVIPFGYHTASLSASKSSYDLQILMPNGDPLHSEGDTESYSFKVDSLLYRGTVDQLRSNIGLTTKENKAYLDGTLLGVGSRKLTVAELGLSYSTQIENQYVNAYLTYQKGLNALNALKDVSALDKEFPKAQFDKFAYGISYNKPFTFAQQNLIFSSTFGGQESLDALYGSEQYSIGSLYTVRGFNQKSMSGDSGYSLKNDLSLLKNYELRNGLLSSKYYVGLDYGKVKNKYNKELVGELSSFSLGSTFNFDHVSFDLILTQPIYQPDSLKEKESDFFFSTTFTF